MKKLIMFIFVIFVLSENILAFDNKITHRFLTDEAIEKSELKTNGCLENNLNLSNGLDTTIDGLLLREWIWQGSRWEDKPACRASNHFHNPRNELPWKGTDVSNPPGSGMSDAPWFIESYCMWSEYPPISTTSNVHWATGYTQPAPNGIKEETGNQWDWDHAREHYYIFLTGKDFQGNQVAGTENEKMSNLGWCFQALGQTLHLIQDMAVPAHVRNDFKSHLDWTGITSEAVFSPTKLVLEKFEYFVEHNITELIGGSEGGDLTDKTLTKFWDTNNYTGDNPSISLVPQSIGLAEYTNINFVSRNTLFAEDFLNDDDSSNDVHYHPYPRESSTNVQEYIDGNMLPKTVIGEDGVPDTSFWIEKTGDGEMLTHFLKPTYFAEPMIMVGGYNPQVFNRRFKIDDECARNYAEKLIPRAVGYSAALLDYFFRGRMHVTALPVIFDNSLYTVMLYVKNITPGQEIMTNGTFSLVVRYTPFGGNSDGSDDIFVRAYDVEIGELQYNQGTDVQFYFPQIIPIENYESVECLLVFKGKLGNEENAVIGKSFSLGEIKFSEEWDNGLNGNYQWTHTIPDENPDNGSTSNVADNNILFKDNIRDVGYKTARFNSSDLNFVDLNNPNGLQITPDTYLQFKIDDLSINEQPPAPEGSTSAWQYLSLGFNNGLGLQFTQEGQGLFWGSDTAYYTFNLGWIIVVNIYDLFQNGGITIPEPFYLESMDLTQQLWSIEDFSTVEHCQHMEVDFMRIVERYVTPE